MTQPSPSEPSSSEPSSPETSLDLSMPASLRLHGKLDFAHVFEAKMRKPIGPIVFWAVPNTLGYPRMGLSVSRRVGNAVRRNRIKRMLREAFRTTQHNWPAGYDMVLAVRGHEPMQLEEYQTIFNQGMAAVHQHYEKRKRKLEANAEAARLKESGKPETNSPAPSTSVDSGSVDNGSNANGSDAKKSLDI